VSCILKCFMLSSYLVFLLFAVLPSLHLVTFYSCISIRAYVWHAVIVQPGYNHFLTSNFADGKNIHFTICILWRPTLLIAVTETAVKAQGSQWWETQTMEVRSGSHRGQIISYQHVILWQKGLLSLLSYLWYYYRYFAFTHHSRTHHTPNCREDV